MKNFRITKCLEDGVVKEFAIFEDGAKKIINEDKDGHKYFLVDNELNKADTVFKKRFYTRIHDAVTTIRNGEGDCLKANNLFENIISVVYFLDRNYGEKMRRKSIEGWKDTEFGWSVEAGNKNSLSGYRKLTKEGEVISNLDNPYRYVVFDTKEEALQYIESLVEKAKILAEELVEKNKVSSSENIAENINKLIDKIDETEGQFSIICDFVFDFLNEEGTDFRNPEKYLTDYGYRVVQCVKPKKSLIKETQYKLDSIVYSVGFGGVNESQIIGFYNYLDENKDKYSSVSELIVAGMSNNSLTINEENGLRLYKSWEKTE